MIAKRNLWLGWGALLLAPALALGYSGGPVEHGGKVTGAVRFKGTPPERQKVDTGAEHCGAEVYSERLIVSPAGAVANVVVTVEGIERGKEAAPERVKLDNKGCRFEPHAQAILAGSEVEVSNGDGFLHNTHARRSDGTTLFNEGIPAGQATVKKFKRPGTYKVKCDVHPWMSAWIVVAESPYFAVTGADGRFEIADIPPGKWKLVAWQEKLGRVERSIEVAPDGEAAVDLELSE